MTLSDMHVWFRQYAQQMGMQNVLAILPEQIDLLINTSITDTVNELVRQNIGMTNDRVITDNSKLGQINALRTLYRVQVVNIEEAYQSGALTGKLRFIGSSSIEKPKPVVHYPSYDKVDHVTKTIDGYVTKSGNSYVSSTTTSKIVLSPIELTTVPSGSTLIEELSSSTGSNLTITPKKKGATADTDVDGDPLYYKVYDQYEEKQFYIPDYLFLVDFSLSYKTEGGDGSETRIFPVRVIDDAYLADTLNDFVLAPRKRSPIITLYTTQAQGATNTATATDTTFDLYIGIDSDNVDRLSNKVNLKPYELRISYIGKPKPVQYLADVGGQNVDCELPESMHVDILKHAVDLYRISISGNLHANQQQEQRSGQDAARANARPQNEGYVQ